MSTFTERHAEWLRKNEYKMTVGVLNKHNLHARELLSEAMSRLSMAATALEDIAKQWEPGFCPSITCSEANALFEAMTMVGVSEEAINTFMMGHAYTDDEDDDLHTVITDDDGAMTGWRDRPLEEEPSPFQAVGLIFYDPVTDSLAIDNITETMGQEE